ncbi:MAG: hypothetical protein KJO13_03990, partial [Gammaproteobacteria bacterium]|nr:hypothetical protein [Gammaproteobacteria bacterium]
MPDLLALNTTLGYSAERAMSARGSEWTLLTQTGRLGKALVIGKPGIVALSLLARQYRCLVAWFLDSDDEKAASSAGSTLGVELDTGHCLSSEVSTLLAARQGQFDLIAIACDIDRLLRDARSTTADFFDSVHSALADDGQCFVVTEIDPRLAGFRRKPEAVSRIPLRRLQRALSFLPMQRTYFLYPDQNRPEEILGWSTELPLRRSNRITRILDKGGLLGPLHNSAAVLGASRSAPSLLRTIIDGALSASGAGAGANVERCLARDNGTMTVLLDGKEARASSVLRIPLSLAADTRLRNAWTGLAEMRQSLPWLRDITPEPMASGLAQGMPYFLEHQCAGITADSLVGEENVRQRVSDTLLYFLLKFEARGEARDESAVAAFRDLVQVYFSEL